MHLLNIRLENFRNFKSAACRLGKHVVLLGENAVGKSNLLHAIRLVLDPNLSDAERYLDEEDFWDGGPAFGGVEVVVSIDVTDFDASDEELACLADYLVEGPPGNTSPVSRLTYRFAPKASVPAGERATAGPEQYEFVIYGGSDPAMHVPSDIRRFLGFTVLPALRDAESDLRAWKRSPLRPLIEAARLGMDEGALEAAAAKVDDATSAIATLAPVATLQQQIRDRVLSLLGRQHALAPTFGFSSTDPRQILQGLRLFVDEPRRRQVSETSLGLANVLYLSLLLLGAEQHVESKRLATSIMGIEEPEAHLHPQMQRVVFRDLLNSDRAVIVSTHSPNIASVASLESLVVLHGGAEGSTLASVAGSAVFTAAQRSDLERYLDVTRAELVFGRGIVLVEGDAEKYVVPAAARVREQPVQLDDYGISVCSVSGVDFVPYAQLLRALAIPFAMITDGDERDDGDDVPGLRRGVAVLTALGFDEKADSAQRALDTRAASAARELLARSGIFVGHRTLESDLLAAGAGPRMRQAFKALQPGARSMTLNVFSPSGTLTDEQEDAMLKQVERRGKGRFAQAVAPLLKRDDVPSAVSEALTFIVDACRRV